MPIVIIKTTRSKNFIMIVTKAVDFAVINSINVVVDVVRCVGKWLDFYLGLAG
jgi:hypothetical protein